MKLLLLFLAACSAAPLAESSDALTDDRCVPPSFTEPGCVRMADYDECFGGQCPERIVCPWVDGTDWELSETTKIRKRVTVEPLENRASGVLLCLVTPDGCTVNLYGGSQQAGTP